MKAYKGNSRYVFASYSHNDVELVHSEILRIQELGANVWFDEGIRAGEEWSETVAAAIRDCSHFVYFITPDAVASEHCRRELTYANQKAVPVTAVILKPTELSDGIELAIGNRQVIHRQNHSEEEYLGKLIYALKIGDIPDPSLSPEPSIDSLIARTDDDHLGILVLPFLNHSADEGIKFVCEGIADEIMSALSQLDSLRVISGSSARQIDQKNRNIVSIGKQLNVQYILEGSVQKSGGKLRINARLPSARTDEVLWADRWDGEVEQIFEIQETITRGVVDALEIQLSSKQKRRLAARAIPDVNAYEYFLRARQLIYLYTPVALDQALGYLRKGEKIIGENTYITAAMGYVHWQFNNLGIDDSPRHLEDAKRCVAALFRIDQYSPEAHRLSGLVKIKEANSIQSSVNHLKISLGADPNNTDSLFWLAALYSFVGRISSGMALAERLLSIDPLTNLHQVLPGLLNMMDCNLNQACTQLLKSHQLNPGNPITAIIYGQALAMNNLDRPAKDIFGYLIESFPGTSFSMMGSFYIHSLNNDKEAALQVATEELKAEAKPDLQSSWNMAQCYALINEQDLAINWLENAIQFGFWNYPLLADRDPLLQSLRENDRFISLMENLKEKWIYFDD